MFLKNIPFEAAVSLGQLQFLKWGFILNLLVCAAAVVFLLISRSRQNRLSKKG
jgi:hypothetical protein